MKRLSGLILSSAMLSISISPAYAMEEATSIVVEPTPPVYAYRFDTPAMSLSLGHDTHYQFTVALTNQSSVAVATDGASSTPLRLATVRPHDQLISPFYDPNSNVGWIGTNRIRSDFEMTVEPGMQANFTVEMKAPSIPGKYMLALAPVLEGLTFFPGEPLLVEMTVDSDSTPTPQYLQATEKSLLIDIGQQQMHQQIGGDDLNVFVVSTGKSGHDTPRGDYTIDFKNDVRYSSAYGLYMDNWMALSSSKYGFVGYGIHKLPYWKTKSGRIYEGADHLGRKVSHGCVRLGYEDSKTIYDWSDEGMKVKII